MTQVEQLGEWAASLRTDDLLLPVRTAARRLLLDALANAAAGPRAPGMQLLTREMQTWSEGGRAATAGSPARLPAPAAAAVNGAAIHAWEFDDTHDAAVVHCTAAVVPAVLAAADQVGGVPGRDALAAVVAGVEVTARLGCAMPPLVGFERSALCGAFGAAAAGARVLGLGSAATAAALGLVYSRCAGNRLGISEGVWSKRWQMGLVAEAGVTAALLAARGAGGPRRVLDGPFGLFEVYARGRARPDQLLADLGTRWETERVSLKPYPCCRFVHPAVDAARAVAHRLDGRSIREVEVQIPEAEMLTLIVSRPDAGGEPVVRRQFSLTWCVAAALSAKDVTLELVASAAPSDAVEALATRVHVSYGPPPAHPLGFVPMRVAVTTEDGKRLEASCEVPPGHPTRPLSAEDLTAKVARCVRFAGRDDREADRLIGLLSALEGLADARVLGDWLMDPVAVEARRGGV